MDDFSWTDGVRAAVSACLPCFTSSQRGHPSDDSAQSENEGRASRTRQTHYDELEGLLGDVDDTDADAETMSLHSNVGEGRRRRPKKSRKRRGPTRSIRLFGLNLFGRPPIQLSDSERDDDNEVSDGGDVAARRSRLGRLSFAHSSSSVSAFDSDASPLDTAAIAQLTAQDAAARAAHEATLHAAEEQRRREEREDKEERRRRRRERKELKRVAQALATNGGIVGDSEAFEGFQGSGQLPPLYSAGSGARLGAESGSAMTSPDISTAHTEFGPFVGGTMHSRSGEDELADGEADFGGEAYTRKTRSRGSDSSRSHTHSQTSASRSQSQTQSNTSSSRYHYFSQGSPLPSPSMFMPKAGLQTNITNVPASSYGPLNLVEVPQKKKRSKISSASQSTDRKSTISPTSTSASLPSIDPASPVRNAFAPVEPYIVEHDSESGAGALPVSSGVSALALGGALQNEGKFPSAGLGGFRRTNSSGSGVFLARRGED